MNTTWSRWVATCAIVSIALFPAGCGDDDDNGGGGGGGGGGTGLTSLDVPEQWWGVWSETSTETDCTVDPPETTGPFTGEIVFCPDSAGLTDEINSFGDGLDDICNATLTANSGTVTCDGTIEIDPVNLPGCRVRVDVDATIMLTGEDSYTFASSFSFTPVSDCTFEIFEEMVEFPAICGETEGSATRISTSTDSCDDEGVTRAIEPAHADYETIMREAVSTKIRREMARFR